MKIGVATLGTLSQASLEVVWNQLVRQKQYPHGIISGHGYALLHMVPIVYRDSSNDKTQFNG
jgi:hypothetical protein